MSSSGATLPNPAANTISLPQPQDAQIISITPITQPAAPAQCVTKVNVAPPAKLLPPLASQPPIVPQPQPNTLPQSAAANVSSSEVQLQNGARISPPASVNVNVVATANNSRKRPREDMAADQQSTIANSTDPASTTSITATIGVVPCNDPQNGVNSGEPPAKKMKTMIVSNDPISPSVPITNHNTPAPADSPPALPPAPPAPPGPSTVVASTASTTSTTSAVNAPVDSTSVVSSSMYFSLSLSPLCMVQGSECVVERENSGESQCYLTPFQSVHDDHTAPIVVESKIPENPQRATIEAKVPETTQATQSKVGGEQVTDNNPPPNPPAPVTATTTTTGTTTTATSAVNTAPDSMAGSSGTAIIATTGITGSTGSTPITVTNANLSDGGHKGKVLTRNSLDLKRYLNGLDDDTIRGDVIPKLLKKNKGLFESIRKKMNHNSILCKIFIRSLSYETQNQTVHDLFATFGNVKEAVIVHDRDTGLSRVCGLCTICCC